MTSLTPTSLLVSALLLLTTTAFLRLLAIHPLTRLRPRPAKPTTPLTSAHLLIVLGSGGHTAEMLSLLRYLTPERYSPRTYIVSSGDEFSAEKAREFETGLLGRGNGNGDGAEKGKGRGMGRFRIERVARARRIHQSLWSAMFSSLRCFADCVRVLARERPDVVVTNGPGTGVVVVVAGLVVRFFGAGKGRGEMRTVYVESWARVKSLSLSGRILLGLGLTDRFFVQWEGLKGGRKEWRGFLVE